MATPKRVEVLPQKGKLVNPYNHVNIVKDEEPSDFMVKSISERPKRNFTDTEPKPKHELFTEPKPKLNTEIITNTIEYE